MLILHKQRMVAWLAIFVMLFASLAPSLSFAMQRQSLEQLALQQICRASKLYNPNQNNIDSQPSNLALSLASSMLPASPRIQASDANQPTSMPPMDANQHFEHCPFCGQHAGQWVLPTVVPNLFFAETNSPVSLVLVNAPVSSTSVHFTPPSQAPPSFNFLTHY